MKRLQAILVLLLLVALPIPAQLTEDPAALLRSGPMLGYATLTESVVWLQTTRSCDVQIRYWPQNHASSARLSPVVRTGDETDHIARFRLSGLQFGTRYDYEIYLDGARVELPYSTVFQTQPMWAWRTDPPEFRVAVGSCLYINDPPFDRPGRPYGGDPGILLRIAEAKPDLMLWLGDNLYYREGDWEDEATMRYRNTHTRATPQLQPLLASTHHYAIWDDHDYGPNDSDRTFPLRDEALEVFRDYWANRTYGLGDVPGVFHRFTWGDIDFFMLDDRFYRSPNRMPPGPGKQMFGEAQLQWLLEGLASSRAPFKIVANGNQMLNPIAEHEGLTNFPHERDRLLAFIAEARIEGVVFVSGDRHHAILIRRDLPGLYPLYDITTSPLSAGLYDSEREKENPALVPGTIVGDQRNFALLEFSGPRTDRNLTIRLIGEDGRERWRREVRASELRFPRSE